MWDLGDTVPLTTQITDAAGALTNASSVVCTIGLPDGTTATPAVLNPSTGTYTADYIPAMAGRFTERWTSTGPATARTDTFDVRPADPGYIVGLGDVKRHLNIPAAKTADDEELRTYIEAATRVVEEYRNETIVRRTITEQIETGAGTLRVALRTAPVLSLTSVQSVDGTYTWNVAALSVDTAQGSVGVISEAPFYGRINFVYVAGYQVIPGTYTLAAKIIIEHLWQLQRRPSINAGGGLFGSLGADRGSETDSTPSGFGFAIPNRAVELLGARASLVG